MTGKSIPTQKETSVTRKDELIDATLRVIAAVG